MAKGGMPPHEPTEATKSQVESLVAFGIPQEHIALKLGISDETLRKYYKYELELGLSNANQQVANVLFSKAVYEQELSAVIFWLKTRGRKAFNEKDPDDDSKKAWSVIEQLLAMKKDGK